LVCRRIRRASTRFGFRPDLRHVPTAARSQWSIRGAEADRRWPMTIAGANFPLDERSIRCGPRIGDVPHPAKLGVRRHAGCDPGGRVGRVAADADDLFITQTPTQSYVELRRGAIDVFDAQTYRRIARIPTVPAPAPLLWPRDRSLMLAVRATARLAAAIWLLPPAP